MTPGGAKWSAKGVKFSEWHPNLLPLILHCVRHFTPFADHFATFSESFTGQNPFLAQSLNFPAIRTESGIPPHHTRDFESEVWILLGG